MPDKADFRAIIERLRAHFTETQLIFVLGIHRRRLKPSDKQGIGLPAARLAYLILRMMEHPGVPMTMIELHCLGKYATAPRQTPHNEPSPSPEFEI
jgi:hypothetical protein